MANCYLGEFNSKFFTRKSLFVEPGLLYQTYLNSFFLFGIVIMSFFVIMVFCLMLYIKLYKAWCHYSGHQKSSFETFVFLLSTIALIFMGYPSMYLLYYVSSFQTHPDLVVKVIASQWYWSFEVSNVMDDPVLMYMLPLEELSVGSSRLLEVDNRLVLPTNMLVQFNVTSSDVIHSFALPTLGMKVDATPGLLCVVHADLEKVGVHYGQCSEICGMNHAYMPFCLEVVPFQIFLYWLMLQL